MPEGIDTTVLSADSPARFDAAVERAVSLLRQGQIVALPTETVYGLAVNALDHDAVARLFLVKGRPSHNPVIVHIVGLRMAQACVSHWPHHATRLAQAFWPGPLTLVLPKANSIPSRTTAGGPTVAIRWPAHPFIQKVIAAASFPLAAPSANLSGTTSPTRADHVLASLGGRIPLIVDGGPCQVGLESTVLDLATPHPRVLRPGMITESQIASILNSPFPTPHPESILIPIPAPGQPLPSPGLLTRHYAPVTPLRILHWNSDQDLSSQIRTLLAPSLPLDSPPTPLPACIIAHSRVPNPAPFARVAIIPADAPGFARALYAELHACDQIGARLIVVEQVPDGDEWSAIADRLTRAAS